MNIIKFESYKPSIDDLFVEFADTNNFDYIKLQESCEGNTELESLLWKGCLISDKNINNVYYTTTSYNGGYNFHSIKHTISVKDYKVVVLFFGDDSELIKNVEIIINRFIQKCRKYSYNNIYCDRISEWKTNNFVNMTVMFFES